VNATTPCHHCTATCHPVSPAETPAALPAYPFSLLDLKIPFYKQWIFGIATVTLDCRFLIDPNVRRSGQTRHLASGLRPKIHRAVAVSVFPHGQWSRDPRSRWPNPVTCPSLFVEFCQIFPPKDFTVRERCSRSILRPVKPSLPITLGSPLHSVKSPSPLAQARGPLPRHAHAVWLTVQRFSSTFPAISRVLRPRPQMSLPPTLAENVFSFLLGCSGDFPFPSANPPRSIHPAQMCLWGVSSFLPRSSPVPRSWWSRTPSETPETKKFYHKKYAMPWVKSAVHSAGTTAIRLGTDQPPKPLCFRPLLLAALNPRTVAPFLRQHSNSSAATI